MFGEENRARSRSENYISEKKGTDEWERLNSALDSVFVTGFAIGFGAALIVASIGFGIAMLVRIR